MKVFLCKFHDKDLEIKNSTANCVLIFFINFVFYDENHRLFAI